MQAATRHHDISDKVWELLYPRLPGSEGTRRVSEWDNRNFLNAVFWSSGQPHHGEIYHLSIRVGKIPSIDIVDGEKVPDGKRCREILIPEPDFEWLMIGTSHRNAPRTRQEHKAAMRTGDAQKVHRKIYQAVEAHAMPFRAFITAGLGADSSQACRRMGEELLSSFWRTGEMIATRRLISSSTPE